MTEEKQLREKIMKIAEGEEINTNCPLCGKEAGNGAFLMPTIGVLFCSPEHAKESLDVIKKQV